MKKRFKSILGLVMAATLVFSVTGCGQKQTAAEIYDAAAQKNASLDSMDMTSVTTQKLSQSGVTTNQTVNADIKMSGLTSDKLEYLMTATTAVGSQSVEMSSFYTDGYYYIDTMGQKIKFAFNIEEMAKQITQSTGFTQFTSADMKELTAKKQGSDQVLTYTIDPEKMGDYMNQTLETMGLDESLISDMSITAMSGEMTVNKDGYYTAMKTNMTMNMTVQGITISTDSQSDITINNPGIAVEFQLPDMEGYQEVDASAMGF